MKKLIAFILLTVSSSFAVNERTCNLLYEVAGECYIKAQKMGIKNENECGKTVELFNALLAGNFPNVEIAPEKLQVLDAYCSAGCVRFVKGYGFLDRNEFIKKCMKMF